MRKFIHLYYNGCCGDGEATHIEVTREKVLFNDRFCNEFEMSYSEWLEIQKSLLGNIYLVETLLPGLNLSKRERGQLKFYIEQGSFDMPDDNYC